MPEIKATISALRLRRPALRMQLALLYSGVFTLLLGAVLIGTRVLSATAHGTGTQPSPPVHPVIFSWADLLLLVPFVAFAVSWWIAGRFLRPLRVMTSAAQEISATNLHRRLGLDGPQDELTRLGSTLDDLFGRLEAAFESQRHFIANASHELRSPITAESTLLQVALADPHATTEMWRSTGEKVLKWTNHQEQLIDALLTLATSERGIEQWEPFDLGHITETILVGRRQEAHRRGIRIDATLAAAPTVGDPRLVEVLVANLIDNALHHNIADGTIEISTISATGRAAITVSNTGPVIPSDDVERLFQPFQQIGIDRVRHSQGHGLGLAIVQAVARAHGAEISARPRSKGGLDIQVSWGSPGLDAGGVER
jgi:signal transduction histidine kinase